MRSVTDRDPRPCRAAGVGSTERGLNSMRHGWWSHRDPAGQPPGLPVPPSAPRRATGAGERVPVRQRVPGGRRRRPRRRTHPHRVRRRSSPRHRTRRREPPGSRTATSRARTHAGTCPAAGYGNNINQAARVLNAGGQLPEWLAHAVALTNRVVGDIDEAVQALLAQPRKR